MPENKKPVLPINNDEEDLEKLVSAETSDGSHISEDMAPSKEGDGTALEKLRSLYNQYYNQKNKTNISLRKKYFNCSFALLFILVFGFIGITIMVCLCVDDNLSIIVSLVSSIGGLVPSVLVLPKTIGDYIFNTNEYDGAKDAIESAKKSDKNKKDE